MHPGDRRDRFAIRGPVAVSLAHQTRQPLVVEPATGESQSIGGAGNVEHSVASEPEAVAQVFDVLTESAGELNAPFVESLHHGPEESVSEVHEHPRVGGEIRFPGSLHEAFRPILSVQSRNEELPTRIRFAQIHRQ